jgi:hypothetical protein
VRIRGGGGGTKNEERRTKNEERRTKNEERRKSYFDIIFITFLIVYRDQYCPVFILVLIGTNSLIGAA